MLAGSGLADRALRGARRGSGVRGFKRSGRNEPASLVRATIPCPHVRVGQRKGLPAARQSYPSIGGGESWFVPAIGLEYWGNVQSHSRGGRKTLAVPAAVSKLEDMRSVTRRLPGPPVPTDR